MTVSTGLEAENEYDLDEDIDQAVRNFEFRDISYYVAVIAFSLDEPVYITEVKEKGRATTEPLSTIDGHNIATGELY